VERVMGIERTLVVWDKRKQWPLPGSCRCVLEGPLLADLNRWRTAASLAKTGCSGTVRVLADCHKRTFRAGSQRRGNRYLPAE
jgi:hypothetical protein